MSRKNIITVERAEVEFRLKSGIKELGILLDDIQFGKLVDFLFLLGKWNSTYNLTAIRDIYSMLTYHLLDSLSVAACLSTCENILDVGSGAGLPGLVLATVYPDKRVSMIDVVQKKTAFINQVRIELGLDNVTVYSDRVEKLSVEDKFDAIISRAFSSLSDFVGLACHLLKENGKFYAMKGLIPFDEIGNLDSGWKVSRIQPLKVPQLDAQRHLIIIESAGTTVD